MISIFISYLCVTTIFGRIEKIGIEFGPQSNCERILRRAVKSLEASSAFEEDDLGRKVMGDLTAKTYANFKRAEWDEYLT